MKIKKKLFKEQQPAIGKRIYEIFGAAAIALVPWMAWLAHLFPAEHFNPRFGWMWGVLDVGEFVTLVFTIYYGISQSGWVVMTAAIMGSLFLADAWFDVLSSKAGMESEIAIGLAFFIEIPLALLAFWIAYRVGRKYFR